ncbi:MAG: ISAzo13-like element transposase-related protein, partial [Streptosporangiaceae bacterium]
PADEDEHGQDGACGAPGALREARRVREAARGNGSLERRDRAPGRLHHRLFSHISMNWRGRPLESHETVVNLIAATTTRTGLAVRAELDNADYPAGVKISDQQMAVLPLDRHAFHGDWNYTLRAK